MNNNQTTLTERLRNYSELREKSTQGEWESFWVCARDCDYSILCDGVTIAELKNVKSGHGADFNLMAKAPSILRDLQQAVGVIAEIRSALKSGLMCAKILANEGGACGTEIREGELPQIERALSKIDELLGECTANAIKGDGE